MKIFIFTTHGSYHSDSVSLQAHIFWISEKQAALLRKHLSVGEHRATPHKQKKKKKKVSCCQAGLALTSTLVANTFLSQY